ncbi:chemotaxis protein CheA [Pluralibacter gergoviae]|uniref:chemotaxis protein CheA n=1 Tax=Pluralibacter gergoviae TaxID=61647 RepID=UPI0006509F29|nr:chemotaxis protein CheA [Pluralibacter gergoviae]KMK08638.1 chemotaxis protein CheA [Pluralibacter gergoviae]
MDISDFYQTFFDEADELMADMESHLLALDCRSPDKERLNAIFRAAHSIKGGAGTFGFTVLQETTHILENLLDDARRGELLLTSDIINLFLESKDIMQDQLDAYKSSEKPDEETFRYICEALRNIALEAKQGHEAPAPQPEPAKNAAAPAPGGDASTPLHVALRGVAEKDRAALLDELGHLGEVLEQSSDGDTLHVQLLTTSCADDILAVLCFVLEADQITIAPASAPLASAAPEAADKESAHHDGPHAARAKPAVRAQAAETGSLRVAVEKVDTIINLVGELIITQAMLSQLSESLDPAQYDTLIASIAQMERNARDLQESVMSIRMMPMEYVFSRFPRLVHDLGQKLGKEVELTLQGGSTELDKSLIERIIDPLTHLVRNSLDHGIEEKAQRVAKGKSAQGNLILSAEHHGGSIVIEVIDDGAGLNRDKILARAAAQGIAINENWSDEEVWMLIFAAGFSTAEQVTDVSGRGVGMDVVRRNILAMGGHVELHSEPNNGTTVRIVLPLTLAILDGMSVRVGSEIYVLPLGTVMESLQPQENALYNMAGGEVMLQVRGEYLPLLNLQHIFGIDGDAAAPTDGIAVILQSAGCRYALLVDQLIGQHQVVVKNLELNYRKVPGISAATILGDGSVALILDIVALFTLSKNNELAERR